MSEPNVPAMPDWNTLYQILIDIIEDGQIKSKNDRELVNAVLIVNSAEKDGVFDIKVNHASELFNESTEIFCLLRAYLLDDERLGVSCVSDDAKGIQIQVAEDAKSYKWFSARAKGEDILDIETERELRAKSGCGIMRWVCALLPKDGGMAR